MDLAPGMSRVGLALAGLLTLFACAGAPSVKEQPKAAAEDTTGQVLASEAQAIASRFPKLAGHYDGTRLDSIPDSTFLPKRLAAAELATAFPTVRFYKCLAARIPPEVHGFEIPRRPYLIAVTADTSYDMTLEFNRLLFATGHLLTDSNIVTMAKAYVVLDAVIDAKRDTADPLGIPPVAVLDAKKLDRATVDGGTYDVYVKAKVGDEVEEHYIESRFGQFRSIYMKNPHLEEDMKKPPGLCGTIVVLGYAPEFPILVDPKSGEVLPGFPGTQ
jgi:hypothetical protein